MQDRYAIRRDRLVSKLKKEGCSSFLVTNFLNVSYLTGFTGDDSYLLITPDHAVLISDSRYEEQIAGDCPDLPVYIRSKGETMLNALVAVFAKYLPKERTKKTGIEAGSVSLHFSSQLGSLPELGEFVPLLDWVEELREIKDKFEIDAIRVSLRCAVHAFNVVRHSLLPDLSEKDIRNTLDYHMMKFGADSLGFPSIVALGPRAALPHAIPTDQSRVGDHELLLIDWGARKDFYVSDLTRVLITSTKPSAKLRRVYNIVLAAQAAAIAGIKPGVTCAEIDGLARSYIEDAGFGKEFGHGLGHGLGMLVHDRGSFSVGSQTVLKPGMVLTVEPGIYLPGWGGIRIEDDILVTRSGCEVLSEEFPKEFDEMMVDL